jgi:hypothetical protein
MFPVDRPSLFGSVRAQVDLLVGPSDASLAAQDVVGLLRAAVLLSRLAGQAEQLSIDIDRELGGRAATLNAAEQLRALQSQLAQIIGVCKGEKPGLTLRQLADSGRQWTEQFSIFADNLSQSEQRQRQRVAFEEALRRTDELMKKDWCAAWHGAWAAARAAALGRLKPGTNLGTAEEMLGDFGGLVQALLASGSTVTAYYQRVPPWPESPADAPRSARAIAVALGRIDTWLESTVTQLNQDPAALPSVPVDAADWCMGPVSFGGSGARSSRTAGRPAHGAKPLALVLPTVCRAVAGPCPCPGPVR